MLNAIPRRSPPAGAAAAATRRLPPPPPPHFATIPSPTPALRTMAWPTPAALETVFEHIVSDAPRGTYVVGQRWPQFSDEVGADSLLAAQ